MTSVLPALIDRVRNARNGKRLYSGQIVLFDGGEKSVIAEVYGESLEQMRSRKRACWRALKELEQKEGGDQ